MSGKKRLLLIPLLGMSLIMASLIKAGLYTASAWQLQATSDPPLATPLVVAPQWLATPVADDPLVRMPGTQPDQDVNIGGPSQCVNCHADYDPLTEPVDNWQGSMMAQAARDFLYWSTVTVAGQDAIWAVGNPNATDICLRCHMYGGWLGGCYSRNHRAG